MLPPDGALVELRGLKGRADLNGKIARLLAWNANAERWEVRIMTTGEEARLKATNLAPCFDDDCWGEIIRARKKERYDLGADRAGLVKEAFDDVVRRHGLARDDKAAALADFLTGDEGKENAIAPAAVAARFGIPPEDAAALLAWIHIGTQFKRDCDQNAAVLGPDGVAAAQRACGDVPRDLAPRGP